MIRKSVAALSIAILSGAVSAEPLPGFVNWTGFYLGGSAGWTHLFENKNQIQFDTTLNGNYGNTVNTIIGTNAFSPGFCNGAAAGALASQRCKNADDDSADIGARIGYDRQINHFVIGGVAEYTAYNAHESISAFSTTPAFYTFKREVKYAGSIRARLGMPFEEYNRWLAYVTVGGTWVNVTNRFSTSNTVNTFLQRNKHQTIGALQGGFGVERYITTHASLGLEYLYSHLKNNNFRVRATRGLASATNPFILVNPNGTDFARRQEGLNVGSLRLVLTWRV